MLKKTFVIAIAILFSHMFSHAQVDIATFDSEKHQLICYHADNKGNLEGIITVDDDINIIIMNSDATVASIDNSLATMEFEYDENEISVKYTVDSQLLSRTVYRWMEDAVFKQKRDQLLTYTGGLTSPEQLTLFVTNRGGKQVYDVTAYTLGLMKNPILTCYGVLSQEPYEVGKTEMVCESILEAIVSSLSTWDVMEQRSASYRVFELFNVWTEDWASRVYQWLLQHRDWNRKLNNTKKDWRNGLSSTVLPNGDDSQVAEKEVKEVENNRPPYIVRYAGIITDHTTVCPGGEENVGGNVPENKDTNVSENGDPANTPPKAPQTSLLTTIIEHTKQTKYGVLDHIAITYFTPNNGHEDWSYFFEKGEIVTKHHSKVDGEEERKHPYYRVWIDYTNNTNPNVWGSVQEQLWLGDGGNILNTYVIDCRGTKSDYMKGHLPRRTSGDQFFFFEDED
ncbi:MAG: hypothetical protein J6N71_04420 [Muribaculaceae bacterium]|nr:hypothetical protein [Muribaculaceae bacterium]